MPKKPKKVKKVKAQYNHGRWIVPCPDCGLTGAGLPVSAEDAKLGEEFLCGEEFPDKYATLYQRIDVRHGKKKAVRYARVPDVIAQAQAWDRARDLGRVYKVSFPRNRKEIERIVRMRPAKNQNWEPGETVSFLRSENAKHGVPEHKR